MSQYNEREACNPIALDASDFNQSASLPYGLQTNHVYSAMNDFLIFLGFVNSQLHTRQIERLESMLMPANFSSIVGEFMCSTIPKYCSNIVKNRYHNGHPDQFRAQVYAVWSIHFMTTPPCTLPPKFTSVGSLRNWKVVLFSVIFFLSSASCYFFMKFFFRLCIVKYFFDF